MRLTLALICTLVVLSASTALYAQRSKPATRTLTLQLEHRISKELLQLGNTYTNAAGDTVTITRFKYYLSNFSLTTHKGLTIKLPPAYYLIDEADSASKIITLRIPDLPMRSFSFMIGVDSARNASGIQSGPLDPARGMYWTWNSGYIMAKLEGQSPAVHASGNTFTYHIGGYRGAMKTMFRNSIEVPEKVRRITLIADLNQWFSGKTILRVGETPVCHNPGPLAVRIANNYASMFINSVSE